MHNPHTLVVFSHLRWNFVYQRPQHLMARLAGQWPVLFIEEPIQSEGSEPRWETNTPAPGVTVCTFHTPVGTPGFHDDHLPLMTPHLHQLMEAHGVQTPIAWLYTPLALPLAQALRPPVMIYDCMDELSAFLHAPPLLLQREAELLAQADLVFTGGPSLYRAKRDRHPSVHCFASSVDAAHFSNGATEPEDQAALPRPRLGFYGVIDERMDIDLLASLAESHPDWQIVMVGPVVKIDPNSLPRHPNILYTGQRGYDELPRYLAGWDVALLPFARNESTRFISPTKTLEYMAAEKMIVSTPITDVVEPYGDVVFIGDTTDAFINNCQRALTLSDDERGERVGKMRAVLEQTSWDSTAAAMARLIEGTLSA